MTFIRYDKTKLQYDLVFHDIISDYPQIPIDLYDKLFDYVFNFMCELILDNRYITLLATLRRNRQSYIAGLVNDVFEEELHNAYDNVYDLGYFNGTELTIPTDDLDYPVVMANKQIIDYLSTHEIPVKAALFEIVNNSILTIFHELYKFTLDSNKSGINYSSYSYIKMYDRKCYVITCHLNIEVVKNYDKEWYDRLSLLPPI